MKKATISSVSKIERKATQDEPVLRITVNFLCTGLDL